MKVQVVLRMSALDSSLVQTEGTTGPPNDESCTSKVSAQVEAPGVSAQAEDSMVSAQVEDSKVSA